jgi:hypothetical protein
MLDKSYTISCNNAITWEKNPQQSMVAKCSLNLGINLPEYMWPAKPVVEGSGDLIIKASIGLIEPFLKGLEQDYQAWARDDPNR